MQQRRIRLLFAYAILLLPMVVLEASHALKGSANSPLEWAPADDPARSRYDEFANLFGSGDVVIASWAGCDVYSSQLDKLEAMLRNHENFFDGSTWLFDSVLSGRDVAIELTRNGMSADVAISHLQGALIGPDGRTTYVLVAFTKEAVRKRAELVPLIRQAIEQTCGVPVAQQHVAGPIIDGLSVDSATESTLQLLAPLSSVVVLFVTIWCLGSWRTAIVIFAVAMYCQAVTLALISLAGDSVSALLVVLPPLVQVLALAAGMHIVNYYRDALTDVPALMAADRAFQIGWLPCLLSASTTAIGMASLMVSDLTPIQAFGAYSSAGVLVTVAIVLTAIPALLRRMKTPLRSRDTKRKRALQRWLSLANVLEPHHGLITLSFAAVMIAASMGLPKLQTSVRIDTLFGSESHILTDYRWLETNVAPIVPIEVVVKFAPGHPAGIRQQLAYVRQFERHLASQQDIGGTLSAATFLPPGKSDGVAGLLQPSVAAENAVVEAVSRLTRQQWLAQTRAEGNLWRIRGFVSANDDIDYARLLKRIQSDFSSLLTDQQGNSISGVTIETTGIMPLVHDIQHRLLDDLQSSFLIAFCIILVVMTVLQGSISAGIVAMIPNVFPTLLLFGTLGWYQVPIDIGSVMTASVALGVAVDDTLHFLTYFQACVRTGKTRKESVLEAYQHCGMAMLQTSITCAAGMAVFAFSDFLPTARFAWMMMGLFAAALVGDLILLPTLLMGPLGRLFVNTWQPPTKAAAESEQMIPQGTNQRNSAASIASPGPNPSITQGPVARIVPRRSSTNATVGDDMLP